jgi:hypothetical protein
VLRWCLAPPEVRMCDCGFFLRHALTNTKSIECIHMCSLNIKFPRSIRSSNQWSCLIYVTR